MTLTYRKLVMPGDLNPANRLFGGRFMQWLDEAAALYVMCQLQTQNIVTVKVSEVFFKVPIKSGDFLEFFADTVSTGRTSVDIEITVKKKSIGSLGSSTIALVCRMTFVQVDPSGHEPVPHRLYRGENG